MLIVFFDSRHGDLHVSLGASHFVQPVRDLMGLFGHRLTSMTK